ncbi:MAG: fasciclin domain-containing protein [Spirochaetota bacterium]
MKMKTSIICLAMAALLAAPVLAQEEPGSGSDETAAEALADHDDTSVAAEVFGEAYEDDLDGDTSVAFFAPNDDVLEGVAEDDLSDEERQELFERHVTYGLAAEAPIEFIDWFAAADQERIEVSEEDEEIVLDEEVAVEDEIPVANGIVYVIDGSLD